MLSSAFFLGKDKDDNNSIRFTYRYIGRRTSPFSDPLLLLKSSILTSLYLHLFINSFNQTLLLLLLLSRFSRVRLCATLEMAARQAPPSLGFSRQEHWSGLPFPSPMNESEKWKWSRSVVSDSATPWTAAYQAPPSMGFSRQEHWSGVPLSSPKCGLGDQENRNLCFSP